MISSFNYRGYDGEDEEYLLGNDDIPFTHLLIFD